MARMFQDNMHNSQLQSLDYAACEGCAGASLSVGAATEISAALLTIKPASRVSSALADVLRTNKIEHLYVINIMKRFKLSRTHTKVIQDDLKYRRYNYEDCRLNRRSETASEDLKVKIVKDQEFGETTMSTVFRHLGCENALLFRRPQLFFLNSRTTLLSTKLNILDESAGIIMYFRPSTTMICIQGLFRRLYIFCGLMPTMPDIRLIALIKCFFGLKQLLRANLPAIAT